MNPKKSVISRHYIDKDYPKILLTYVGECVEFCGGKYDFDAIPDHPAHGMICDNAEVERYIREVK